MNSRIASDVPAAFGSDKPHALHLLTESTSSPEQAHSHREVERLRVLHVINGEHYSGAERVQDLLAARLSSRGVDVEFACVKPDRFPELRVYQEAVLHRTAMAHKFDMSVIRRLTDLIRTRDYDLVHAHTPRSAMVAAGAARACGLPFVFHVHSPTSRDSTRRWTNWINQRIESWALRRAAAVVTVSDSLRQHMESLGVPAHRLCVVANGVPKRAANSRELFSGTSVVLGSVALFRPRKGTEVLLHSIAKLRQAGLDVRLRAVGGFETQEYERSLRDLAKSLGVTEAVEWVGFVRDVGAELEKLDLFVLPSLFGEGMPMVVLEAMAAGIPVIATRVEGVPQVIEHGRHGWLVEPGSSDSLADALETLMTSPELARTLADRGRQRQQESFSDDSMAEGVASLYRRLI